MAVADYLIGQEGKDWPVLLSDFHWLLPPDFTLWMVNRFGDLFIVTGDEAVHMVDIGGGTIRRLAEDRHEFGTKIDLDDNANQWLMIPLVDRCVQAGSIVSGDQCYSYRKPPVLGGDYTVENTFVSTLASHYSFYGSFHDEIRKLPDGSKVRINVRGDA